MHVQWCRDYLSRASVYHNKFRVYWVRRQCGWEIRWELILPEVKGKPQGSVVGFSCLDANAFFRYLETRQVQICLRSVKTLLFHKIFLSFRQASLSDGIMNPQHEDLVWNKTPTAGVRIYEWSSKFNVHSNRENLILHWKRR